VKKQGFGEKNETQNKNVEGFLANFLPANFIVDNCHKVFGLSFYL
jgi:hypothetical protein